MPEKGRLPHKHGAHDLRDLRAGRRGPQQPQQELHAQRLRRLLRRERRVADVLCRARERPRTQRRCSGTTHTAICVPARRRIDADDLDLVERLPGARRAQPRAWLLQSLTIGARERAAADRSALVRPQSDSRRQRPRVRRLRCDHGRLRDHVERRLHAWQHDAQHVPDRVVADGALHDALAKRRRDRCAEPRWLLEWVRRTDPGRERSLHDPKPQPRMPQRAAVACGQCRLSSFARQHIHAHCKRHRAAAQRRDHDPVARH